MDFFFPHMGIFGDPQRVKVLLQYYYYYYLKKVYFLRPTFLAAETTKKWSRMLQKIFEMLKAMFQNFESKCMVNILATIVNKIIDKEDYLMLLLTSEHPNRRTNDGWMFDFMKNSYEIFN